MEEGSVGFLQRTAHKGESAGAVGFLGLGSLVRRRRFSRVPRRLGL